MLGKGWKFIASESEKVIFEKSGMKNVVSHCQLLL